MKSFKFKILNDETEYIYSAFKVEEGYLVTFQEGSMELSVLKDVEFVVKKIEDGLWVVQQGDCE